MSLVNYNKTTWKAGKDGGTPINPSNLNKIEDGIEAVTDEVIDINSELAAEIFERKAEVDVERKRIDNIVALPEGSTTADAELIDIRVGADGTTYSTAGESVRGQIGELKGDLNAIVEDSINLFDVSKVTSGYLEYNGEIHAHDNYVTSDFIKTKSGVPVLITGITRYLLQYDTNKNAIQSSYVAEQTNYSFTPTTDGYVRFTVNVLYKEKLMCSYNSRPESYRPYYKTISDEINLSDAKKSEFVLAENSKNIFDKSKCEVGYINQMGEINSKTTDYLTSEYIPVYINEPISIYPKFRKFLLYDISKEYTETFIDGTNSEYSFVPTRNGYIRISVHKEYVDVVSIQRATNVTDRSKFGTKHISNEFGLNEKMIDDLRNNGVSDLLNGKKWCVVGDSFSWGGYSPMDTFDDGKYAGHRKVYPYFIGNRTGINIVDFTLGGRTLAYPADGTFTNSFTCPTADCYYQNIPTDVDYITIYLGINDSHHERGESGSDGESVDGVIPIGTINDTTTATYYGAWNVVLTWLIQNRPFAHIGIIVSNGCDAVKYRTAQLEIAKKYGIPYIDMNGDSRTPAMIRSLNPDIDASVKAMITNKQAVNMPTNQHPNYAAHEYESTFIENFLRSL